MLERGEAAEIVQLATLAGILAAYHDQTHRLVETSLDARRAVLDGLGFPTDSAAQRKKARDRLQALRDAPFPRLIALPAQTPTAAPLKRATRGALSWSIELESGDEIEGSGRPASALLDLPALPAGYHRLFVRTASWRAQGLIVAAPPHCWHPPEILEGRKGFGLTAQIYGLRSPRQFGLGDYTDVGDLAEGAAHWGASFLGLSPAHALFPFDPGRHSPYSPSSRLFLQTILIDPAAIAAGASAEIAKIVKARGLVARLAQIGGAALIDYGAVSALKRELFDCLWEKFGDSERADFEDFKRDRGEALEQHATFDALSERFASEGALASSGWPEAFRSVDSPEVIRFRRDHSKRVEFHAWLQWIADRQFAAAHARARAAGMTIGLYRDLAVGADPGGSEVWCAPSRYLHTMSIGAPPDPLGPQGQTWGLPPFDPIALEEKELRPFRDLVRANMRHAGALRIDHAFQLRRLFMVPNGATAAAGAYVTYPLEALLGVLRIESHRAKCLVIAEDLGTAPRGFSDAIMQAGILSYRLFSFERDQAGGFKSPASYPREALAAISTHDLPTFKGWWRGVDIDLRECFGFFDAKLAEQEREARAADRARFVDALTTERLQSQPDEPEHAAPILACLRFVARTPSALAAIQIEDAIGEMQQANLPGPSTGHPNWRRRLSLEIADIVATDGPVAHVATTMALETRGFEQPLTRLSMEAPRATYRLQFSSRFGFAEAEAIVPYLRDLGISHVYASPITAAARGSTHGYDVNDYAKLNPELGDMAAFVRFSDALRNHGLGLIVDFVPNHMGVAGTGNDWWTSVLAWGERSPHAHTFDIDFDSPSSPGKVLLPVLGKPYRDALASGEASLKFDPESGSFFFGYFDQRFPVRPDLYAEILRDAGGPDDLVAVDELCARLERLVVAQGADFLASEAETKDLLAQAVAHQPKLRRVAEGASARYVPSTDEGLRALDDLLAKQHYRLAYWRLAASEINYRRFFDIAGLAGVRVEDPRVFARIHDLLFALVRDNRVQGIRLDHIDGLADPATYLDRLQGALGPGFYVVVEKILERGERLRDWPIAGSTGYEVLAELDQIFVDGNCVAEFDALYRQAAGVEQSFDEQVFSIKASLAVEAFGGELANLTRAFHRLASSQPLCSDLDAPHLQSALVALAAGFPVYRSYIDARGADDEDRCALQQAAAAARKTLPEAGRRALDFIVTSMAARNPDQASLQAAIRFQQLTGPLMAKSLEDTLFYRYGRLIALNEVGGDPSRFGEPLAEFHANMRERAEKWPAALTATATHDTKRGEDARARLIAAAGSPELWRKAWSIFERCSKRGRQRPDSRDLYFFFQAIVAALPIELIDAPDDATARHAYLNRVKAFAIKALREAKRRTSWTEPDASYEEITSRWIENLFSESDFLGRISPLAQELAWRGCQLSLSRTVVKCALPGVPDFYQGTEFWDFSFVDPDNRRPVDYRLCSKALDFVEQPQRLLENWRDGRIKQAIIARMLADRTADPDLYAKGEYTPLGVADDGDQTFLAFERRRGDDALVVVAALRFGAGATDARERSRIELEEGRWRNLLDGETLQSMGSLAVEDILGPWPAIALRKLH